MKAPWRALLLAGACAALARAAPAAGDAQRGMPIFQKYCSQCHGTEGGGDGPASHFVLPRPRIFKDNDLYKFRTTPSGELPTDDDMLRVVTRGIPGTSMPAFSRLPEQDRQDLVAAVKSFAPDFADATYTKTAVPVPEVAQPKPVAYSKESIDKGAQVFATNKCWQCHGQKGRGDGPSWPDLKDADTWGKNPILPQNLTNTEHYRNGSDVADIFRTVTTGINGTPMPAFADSITVEDRWHLANYIRSLGPAGGRPRDEVVVAIRATALPAADDDAAWKDAPVARFETFSNVVEPPRLYWPSVEFVMAQAMYTDQELALRVQWDDRSESKGTDVATVYQDRDGAIKTGTQHPDQLAIQFPARVEDVKARPYFLFGDSKRAVGLWWWRSDTAAFQEVNAKGFGNFTPQDAASQGLQGTVTWADGRYTLVVKRALTTEQHKLDMQFATGGFVPMAFHAWDGDRGELGSRGAMTNWRWLYLEPAVPRAKLMARAGAAGLVMLALLGIVVVRTRRSPAP